MTAYEYKILPAPKSARKASGFKQPEEKFAHALEQAINDMARKGWEFQRAETLPDEERRVLKPTQIVDRSVLVFRRPMTGDPAEVRLTAAPTITNPIRRASDIS